MDKRVEWYSHFLKSFRSWVGGKMKHWRRGGVFCVFCLIVILAQFNPIPVSVQAETLAQSSLTETQAIPPENLSQRALIALPQDGGKVFLSWRILQSDSTSTNFNVYRSETQGSGYTKIATVSDSSNYKDDSTINGRTYYYFVRPLNGSLEGQTSNEVSVSTSESGRDYIRIPLARNTCGDFNRNQSDITINSDGCGLDWIVVGDLNGDGLFDYVIKTPETPYTTDRSNGLAHPYHLEAYSNDGTFLWEYDTGLPRDVDGGTHWNSSYTLWDMDGDQRAEVMTRAKIDNDYYLVMLDGLTGQELRRTPWLPHTNTPHGTRPMLAIAYLDGIHPAIIVSEGTYGDNITAAYDGNLNEIWDEWFEGGDRYTAHHMIIVDSDGDGRDEILQSSNLIDDDGTLIFSKGWGHSDGLYAADIDPDNPGLEAFFTTCGSSNKCKEYGAALFDLDTGDELWHYQGVHLHGAGYVGEIFPDSPGLESMAHDEANNAECDSWPKDELRIFSASGEILYSANPSWRSKYSCSWISWDDDELCDDFPEVADISGHHFMDNNEDGKADRSPSTQVTLLNPLGTVDIFGDFREEFVMMTMTDFYIYTNTEISHKKQTTPLHDRHYRQQVALTGSGYGFEFHELGYGFANANVSNGDIDQDGDVDVVDLQLCINVFLGSETNPGIVARSDMNGDGLVNNADIRSVLEVILTRQDDD
jgi:rhamnogalacturonan endolyase